MNATSLRDERVVKQLPTGGWGRGEGVLYPRTLWRCRQNSDQGDYVGNNWILLFLSHCGFRNATAKIKREPHPAGTWWTSDERAENEIKREIMMNSQSVPEASFAHESDRVWSRRECHAWPSREEFSPAIGAGSQMTSFTCGRNSFVSISHASQVFTKGTCTCIPCTCTPTLPKRRGMGDEQDSLAGI